MMMADMLNRWVYKGSMTTPSCDTFVYWNVLTRIYPIQARYLALFKKQLARGGLTQNYRAVQAVNTQSPYIIQEPNILLEQIDSASIQTTTEGVISIKFASPKEGVFAEVIPRMSGAVDIIYKQPLKRKVVFQKYEENGSQCLMTTMCSFLSVNDL